MIRARFKTNAEDYRPVLWPITHPYWCTGYTEDKAVIVAYADDEAEIKRLWPDAENIDVLNANATEYTFSTRFARPSWMNENPNKETHDC